LFTLSQTSAISQKPADARHVFPLNLASAGQVALDPVQVSAWSHTPADGRQVWPKARKVHVEVQHDVASALLGVPVKVQLVNQGNGVCFEANYSTASSTISKFKAKQ
jgi:hypothetical protein